MMSADAIQDLSRRIVGYLGSLTDEPLTTFRGLLEVASRLGCTIKLGDNFVTSYHPDETTDAEHAGGIIALNVTGDAEDVGRGLLHEICHHVFAWWGFWHIPCSQYYAYRLGEPEFEELTCRAVVELVLPFPVQFQWNGKLAVPQTGPVFRHFPVKFSCPGFMQMSDSDIEDLEGEKRPRI